MSELKAELLESEPEVSQERALERAEQEVIFRLVLVDQLGVPMPEEYFQDEPKQPAPTPRQMLHQLWNEQREADEAQMDAEAS